MIFRDQVLENEKVLLRPLVKEDFSALQQLTQDPEMWVYFTHDLSIPEQFEDWAAPHFRGERLQFTVIEKSSGALVGSTAFGNYSERDARVEIGWTWLGKSFQGKGINPAMKAVMLDFAFGNLKFKRVEIKTDVLNIPARTALKNIGATEEGILRSHTQMIRNRRRDTIYYSFIEGEWPVIR